MGDALKDINPRAGHGQMEKAREDQVKNSAGGYVFAVDDMTRLDRFLMLGTDGGTYYASEKKLTKDNADFIMKMARENGVEMVKRIVKVSVEGRAPRQNPTMFSLAVVSALGDNDARKAAFNALPWVARTATHLFQFMTYREQFGGWGRNMRNAVAKWYNSTDANKLAYQMVKYRSRDGWTHRDALRLSHPKPENAEHNNLYAWAAGKEGWESLVVMPELIHSFERLQKATSVDQVIGIIQNDSGISWEMIPDRFINQPEVWEALFKSGIPQTALMRQLPRLTRLDLLTPLGSPIFKDVIAQLTNEQMLHKARIHPMNALMAASTYASGKGKGSTWTPVARVIDALNEAFYRSFKNVEPTGKNLLLAVDVSGSMGWEKIAGYDLTPMKAAAAMSLITERTEPNSLIMGFSHELVPLRISSGMRLDDVVDYMDRVPMGNTDLSLPVKYALQNNLSVDAFVAYTDNETWAGRPHVFEILKQYRQKVNAQAKYISVAFTSTGFSVADPSDAGMLDVVGLDSSVPNLISDFIRD